MSHPKSVRYAILTWLDNTPQGSGSNEITLVFERAKSTITDALYDLVTKGEIKRFSGGRWSWYYTEKNEASAKLEFDRMISEREAARRSRNQSAEPSTGTENPELKGYNAKVIVMAAKDAPPLAKTGPCSVFELASFLGKEAS